jgi:hypothetical protein
MRINLSLALLSAVIIFTAGCSSKSPAKKELQATIPDTVSATDTGYTGIKKYMSGKYLIKEVTFKNGVKQGLMKAFYETGEVRHTYWFENGFREDSSIWFFQEGQKFRVTPYKKDTIDGIQRQYYRSGQLKAKIGFSKGLRTTLFQEFKTDGRLIGGYPHMLASATDLYKTQGTYKVELQLSDKSPNVRFWRGDLSKGVFDTTQCTRLKTIKGICTVNLKKSSKQGPEYLGIIAEILTDFGNNFLEYKKIELPYKDLK